jgi:ribose 5-phosphate isomerase B
MIVAIGNDHAGTQLKTKIIERLKQKGFQVINFGTDLDESVDYPDFAHPVAQSIQNKEADFAIVVCGSGNGVNIVVNKYSDVRSALCWNTEIAALARQHNNANIIAVPARFVSDDLALAMVDTFLSTEFEGGRHQLRVSKI